MGSLVTALASWVDARQQQGRWTVRIEDIDPPREIKGAARDILTSLEQHRLLADGAVIWQSQRSSIYDAALNKLRSHRQLYACTCTRKSLRERARLDGTNRYGGWCRQANRATDNNPLRVKVPSGVFSTVDLAGGQISACVESETGDFIVRRRDGLYAYQLAVVADDADQRITHIVRGNDLRDNTPRQMTLQMLLGLQTPAYLHIPLVLQPDGRKLSKQTGASALDDACLLYTSPSPRDS